MEKDKGIKKNIYSIMCNGSKYSQACYDLVTKEFFDKINDFLFLVHIKLSNQNELPFIKQADSVKSLYESKLISSFTNEHYNFSILDKNEKESLSLTQGYNYCLKIKADYMIIGYQGSTIKKKDDLTLNLKYIIDNIKIPCLIIKDYTPRSNSKGYVWLACIDGPATTSRGWAAMEKCAKFIKPTDVLICLHVKGSKKFEEKIEPEFKNFCESKNFNGKFLIIELSKGEKIQNAILNYVNYNDITPDFIILGHNNSNYFNNEMGLESPAIEVIRKAESNIFFYTNI